MFARSTGHDARAPPSASRRGGPGPSLMAQGVTYDAAGRLAAPIVSPDASADEFGDDPEGGSGVKRTAPSVMGFGRRKDAESMPVDIPELMDGVKVDVFVR